MFLKKLFIYLFAKTIDSSIKVIYDEEMFCYDSKEHSIHYNFNTESMGFMRHIEECHDHRPQFCEMLYSILHELGHAETWWDFTDEELDEDMAIRAQCALVSYETARESIEVQNTYFDLPLEWAATEWAIEYSMKHPIKCRIFDSLL